MKSLLLSLAICCPASAFVLPSSSPMATAPSSLPFLRHADKQCPSTTLSTKLMATPRDDAESTTTAEISTAPTLNGKIVLPVKAMTAGLKGHKVAAVYAILNSEYKRGSGEGWEHAQHVSITRDLASDISHFLKQKGPDSVANIRALSFSYPQKATMQDFASGWRLKVQEAGGVGAGSGWGDVPSVEEQAAANEVGGDDDIAVAEGSTVVVVGDDYEIDEDDEDMDEDDLDDYMQMMAESRSAVSSSPPPPAPLFLDNTGLTDIVSLGGGTVKTEIMSPFESAVDNAINQSTLDDGEPLELTIENVDRVLDEVRPYLISDGGNVSVPKVDPETGNVYLLLEGACGSCASSTVTMKMGIERVLIEKFGDTLGEVIQVDPEEEDGEGKATELTIESVQEEVNRISTAIVAMGGVVRVVGVDPIGVVEIEYRGPNRVKKGLELALLDVEFVKHVKFVS